MNESNNSFNFGCIGGFSGLLTIAFIVLKLCKVINWSWIWVLAPAWISIIISIGFLLAFLLIAIHTNITYRRRY